MMRAPTRYRPGTHQRGEDTRRRILETALEVFAADGYDGASTRMLAERAGVNLPAIQYYFGSKEGLYRAAIEHVIQHINERMAPVADRVGAALKDADPSRKDLLALLYEMLDTFVAHVMGGEQLESRRLFFARAEIERTGALDLLHEAGMRQIVRPCAALIGRLLDRPAEDEMTVLRTLTILGQIVIFCNTGARRALGWTNFDEDRMRAVQKLVREQTAAIFRAAKAQCQVRRQAIRV